MSDQTTVVFTFDEGGKRKKYRFQVSADSFKEIKQKTQKLHTELQESIYGAKGGPEYPIQYESE